MCDKLYVLTMYSQRFRACLQRLKHREYSKNAIKIPPPKPEKGGEKRKKSKNFFKSGGQTLM